MLWRAKGENMKNQQLIIGCVISAVVGGGLGFYGNTLYTQSQRNNRMSQFTNTRTGQFNGAQTGRPGNGVGQTSGMRGGAVNGEVMAKDDKSLTVKLADGSSKIVILSGSTTYRHTSDSSLSEIAVGTKISTFGTANADGSVTAQNIQIDPIMPSIAPQGK